MATDAVTSGPPRGLRNNRNWHKLLVAQGVSLIGDYVFDVTVLLWVATVIAAHRPWAPVAASGVLIAAAIPILAVAPIAGVFVDRWDRRRTMRIADLVRAAVIALLLLVPTVGKHWPITAQLTMIYACVLIASVASQFFNPSRFAIIAAAIAKEDRPRAFGISGATANTAAVIGPPLAAPLLFSLGVEWALLINVASFLVSYACMTAIKLPATERRPAKERQPFWREFWEGLSFFGHNKQLVVLCGTVVIYTLGVGAINALDVFFVKNNLHTSANWLGTLNAGLGIGSIIGALIGAKLAGWLTEARVFSYGVVATGLLILVYSRLGALPPAIAIFALAGIPLAAVSVVIGPIMLRVTPTNLIGRVATVMNPLVYLASIISMAVAGVLASSVLRNLHVVVAGVTFGRIDTIFGFSALLMAAAGLLSIRPLRESTKAPAPAPTQEQASAATS
jgi:MFS family permease